VLVFVPELLLIAGRFLHFSDLPLHPPLVVQEQIEHLLISVPLTQYFGLVTEHWLHGVPSEQFCGGVTGT
jgi:hypothetical protein